MRSQFEIKEIRYTGTLKCRKCGNDLDYDKEPYPQGKIYCDECNEFQPYECENNSEINVIIGSLDTHCEIGALLSIDHKSKNFIPKSIGPFLDCKFMDFPHCREIGKEFLRKKGRELEEEDFWKEYKFVDDFSKA
ncbi:MAG: hypothetical protein HXS40_10135 [Theionarchaea archaeon]|nr:hypothetical protein [Theionarchaea archaeon]